MARVSDGDKLLEFLCADTSDYTELLNFLKAEHSEENLLFYSEVEKFKQQGASGHAITISIIF